MRDVAGLRDSAERARRNRPGDLKMVVITPELAEQIADLADAARWLHEVECREFGDDDPAGPSPDCGECDPCRFNAALARLDGEDTG